MATSKIDGIIFRGGAHTQQDFRQRILNLIGSEHHPHVSAINFADHPEILKGRYNTIKQSKKRLK